MKGNAGLISTTNEGISFREPGKAAGGNLDNILQKIWRKLRRNKPKNSGKYPSNIDCVRVIQARAGYDIRVVFKDRFEVNFGHFSSFLNISYCIQRQNKDSTAYFPLKTWKTTA